MAIQDIVENDDSFGAHLPPKPHEPQKIRFDPLSISPAVLNPVNLGRKTAHMDLQTVKAGNEESTTRLRIEQETVGREQGPNAKVGRRLHGGVDILG